MTISDFIIVFSISTFSSIFGLIFGGGNLFLLPAMFLIGIDPKVALATDKIGALGQNIAGSYVFIKHKNFDKKVLFFTAPAFLIGSVIGSLVLLDLDTTLIKQLVGVAIIGVAFFSFIKTDLGLIDRITRKSHWALGIFLYVLGGFYSTTISAGGGILGGLNLVYCFGLSYKKAIGMRPLISFLGHVAAGAIFISYGVANLTLLIPLLMGRLLGSYLGAHLTLKSDAKKLKIIFNIIIIGLALHILLR